MKDKKMISSTTQKLINIYSNVIKVEHCPWCGSKRFIKHGKYKYTYRYRCKECNRTFLPSTGTSLHYLHKKEVFIEYAESLKLNGMQSIKEMSNRFGIAILTSFDWRHKILMSIPVNEDIFDKELLCSEIWFLYSQKGRRGVANSRGEYSRLKKNENYKAKVLSVSDNKTEEMKFATIGPIDSKKFIRALGNRAQYLQQIIFTEKRLYKSFKKESDIKYSIRYTKKIFKEEEIIKYFREKNNQLRNWINCVLRGVSTKYLALYCNYFLSVRSKTFNPLGNVSLNQKFDWPFFTLIEDYYKNFIKKYTAMNYTVPTKRKWKTSIDYYFQTDFFLY